MASWGLCFYGPCQFYWYRLLDNYFGAKTTANFLTKARNPLLRRPLCRQPSTSAASPPHVPDPHGFRLQVALNQLILAPVVSTSVFAWTLACQNQLEKLPDKMRNDLIPTITSGWKFWVPASGINFKFIPLRFQVLYMSTCGLLWTGYLSFASNTSNKEVKAKESKSN